CPSGLRSRTGTAPGAWAGAWQVTLLAETNATPVQGSPSNHTSGASMNPAPFTVTERPPSGPLAGETEVTVGGGSYVKPFTSTCCCPSALRTVTSTLPAACAGA